ncbi:MAG TPA: EamA family transporter [Candidatus Nanoarchaeia archaeon]|nr:EamA family transporter [Candidatus Nanoarchaeia archaeon]
MENWVFFVLIAQFIWSFTTMIDKFIISKKHISNPLVYIIINGLTNLAFIFLLLFFKFEPLSFGNFMIALISSTGFAVGIILYYKAVQYEEISRITLLYQSTPLFVFGLSMIFLSETLSAYHLLGFFFLLCAGIIAAYKKFHNKFVLSKAFYLMIASNIFIAVAYISAKHVFNVTGFWSAVLWLRVTGFVALTVLLIPSVRKDFVQTFKEMKNKIRGLIGFKMLIDSIAFVASDFAILLGPVSLVSALSNASLPLFVFGLAILFTLYFPNIIKEDIHKKSVLIKMLALAFVIAGIFFISL